MTHIIETETEILLEKIVDVQPGLNILKNFLKRSLVEIFIYYKLSAISL